MSQIYYSAKLLNYVHLVEVIKLVIYWWPICLCLDNGDLEEGVGANHYVLHCKYFLVNPQYGAQDRSTS